MKERPILFNGEMVRAILAGRKTQTRRLVKGVPDWVREFGKNIFTPVATPKELWVAGIGSHPIHGPAQNHYKFPFGQIGDHLWVRETHQLVECIDGQGVCYKADDKILEIKWEDTSLDTYKPTGLTGRELHDVGDHPWRPSIHMPRWASRITLEVTGVRVERLESLSKQDAIAEGIQELPSRRGYYDPVNPSSICLGDYFTDPRDAFLRLWDSVYESADTNPWVWVIEFKRV